jgi:acetyl esterase/lipase
MKIANQPLMPVLLSSLIALGALVDLRYSPLYFNICQPAEAQADGGNSGHSGKRDAKNSENSKSSKDSKDSKKSQNDKFENLSYLSGPVEKAHSYSLYLPSSKNKSKNFPLLIYVHGGAWTGRPNASPSWVNSFVKDGYAVAIVYYRLAQEGPFPAQMEDLNSALRFFKSNADKYHIDANRIGLWGHSAGGHLVALMATSANSKSFATGGDITVPRDVKAVCDFAGPANLYDLGTKTYPQKQWDTASPGSSLSLFLGGTASTQKARALEASPDTYVSAGDPPFLIVHGTADKVVPVEQSDELVALLKKNGVDTTYMRLEGAAHNLMTSKNIEAAHKFFDKHLKPVK